MFLRLCVNIGRALQYAWDDLRADPAVVLEAVEQDPGALQYARRAARALRADRSVVLAAVRKIWTCVMQYVSDDLRADPAVVLEAVQQDPEALAVRAWCGPWSRRGRPQSRSWGCAQIWACAGVWRCRRAAAVCVV